MSECLSKIPTARTPFTELDRRFSVLNPDSFHSPAFSCSEKSSASGRNSTTSPGFARQRRASTAANSRRFRTEDIMRDLFPQHIAEALLAGEKVPPERKEMITMFFR